MTYEQAMARRAARMLEALRWHMQVNAGTGVRVEVAAEMGRGMGLGPEHGRTLLRYLEQHGAVEVSGDVIVKIAGEQVGGAGTTQGSDSQAHHDGGKRGEGS